MVRLALTEQIEWRPRGTLVERPLYNPFTADVANLTATLRVTVQVL